MSDHPLKTAIELLVSPLGGGAIYLLFKPAGCASDSLFCPPGERINGFGSTMGGLVGSVSDGGAALIGILAAVACYLLLHTFWPEHT